MKYFKTLFLICLSIICFCKTSDAQKPLISDYEEIVKRANAEIDASMQSGGMLFESAKKHKVQKGEFVMNVSIHEKGKVISVFVVSGDAEDVKQQNLVKDLVRQMEFNFKMPKGKIYKFEHTFKFE